MRRRPSKVPAPMREGVAFWLVMAILFGLGAVMAVVAIYTVVAPNP